MPWQSTAFLLASGQKKARICIFLSGHFMHKPLSIFLFILLLSGCSQHSPTTKQPNKIPQKIRAQAAYPVNTDNSAYVVFDLNQKKFLEGKELNLVRPIASITKLMTAIVFLENRQSQCQTAILSSDADFIKNTSSPLPKNVPIACSELLKAMLVRSDNEAAHALAHATPLKKAQFIARMNQKAKELGLTHTAFSDSSGLSAQNVSTVSDLAKLASYAASKPEIRQLSNMPSVEVYAAGKPFYMSNTNRIVRDQRYAALVSKTGYTREAGYNLVFINRGDCKGKRIGIISLNNSSSSIRADFTEAMLAKYQCKTY